MKVITQHRLQALSREAVRCARRRANWNLHPSLDDPIQRFCNAMEPATYVRPHRHEAPARWELFLALSGAAAVVTFSDDGCLLARASIGAEGPDHGIEIPVGIMCKAYFTSRSTVCLPGGGAGRWRSCILAGRLLQLWH